jgi:hypothetical protein
VVLHPNIHGSLGIKNLSSFYVSIYMFYYLLELILVESTIYLFIAISYP